MNDLFTFGACFRFKAIAAFKGQQGWPSFTPPYRRRYLTATVTTTEDRTLIGYPTETETQVFKADRITGQVTNPTDWGFGLNNPNFPYGQTDFTSDPNVDWTITETYYKHVLRGVITITTEVQLSDEYTLPMLESDLDDLIARIDLNTLAWGAVLRTGWPNEMQELGPEEPEPSLALLLPATVNYSDGTNGIQAAGWNIWAPGFATQQAHYPNGASKLVTFIAMPGNYCKKSFYIDIAQNLLNQTCDSGRGSCQNPFKVNPPPLSADWNSYCLIERNCQCSQNG